MTVVRQTLAARFWLKVDTSSGLLGCWPWRASRNRHGYGEIGSGGHNGRILLAHRVAYEIATGQSIPPHLVVMHTCDNPGCVNPAHLRLGSPQDNIADRQSKKRTRTGRGAPPPHYRGEANPAARLTVITVEAMRAGYSGAAGDVSRLARQYDVSRRTVRRVVTGQSWSEAFGR